MLGVTWMGFGVICYLMYIMMHLVLKRNAGVNLEGDFL